MMNTTAPVLVSTAPASPKAPGEESDHSDQHREATTRHGHETARVRTLA